MLQAGSQSPAGPPDGLAKHAGHPPSPGGYGGQVAETRPESAMMEAPAGGDRSSRPEGRSHSSCRFRVWRSRRRRLHLPCPCGSKGDNLVVMKRHDQIDKRSLALTRRIVALIDADPQRKGLDKARATCARWYRDNPVPAVAEWIGILQGDWATVRAVLLDESEEGQRLRQSSPFCGILSPKERWAIYRRSRHEPKAA